MIEIAKVILIHLELALNLLLLSWMATMIDINSLILLNKLAVVEVKAFLLMIIDQALTFVVVLTLGKTRVVRPQALIYKL